MIQIERKRTWRQVMRNLKSKLQRVDLMLEKQRSGKAMSKRLYQFALLLPVLLFAPGLFGATLVSAQQITGVPGSPNATVMLDGKQLPPPPMPFGGVIKESAKDSTPWWPPRVVPPKA